MTKKGRFPIRPIHRIDLSLPIVKTASYEIYYTVPPVQSRQPSGVRPVTRQKPLIDIQNHTKSNNQATTTRIPPRFKNITGSVFVNLFAEMPPVPTDSSATMADTISNALIDSGYSGQTLRTLPSIVKHSKYQTIKDDGERSQASSDDRLLFESIGSFEDPFLSKTKHGMWHNVHHPQLTTIKILHTRQKPTNIFSLTDFQSRGPNTSSLGQLSQESLISANDRLYEKVEHLTRSYFPSILKLRHSHPCPELINNRMHLHREEKRDYVPTVFRPRIGR